jgi:ATP-dependent DNA helicase RecG
LSLWPRIELKDDRDACLFTSTIYRDTQKSISGSDKTSEKSSEKTDVLILENLAQHPQMTIKDLSEILGISTRAVEKKFSTLKETGKTERKGSRKQGCWKIIK